MAKVGVGERLLRPDQPRMLLEQNARLLAAVGVAHRDIDRVDRVRIVGYAGHTIPPMPWIAA